MEGLPLCEEVRMEGPLWGGDDSASVWISSLHMECFYMYGGYNSALRVCPSIEGLSLDGCVCLSIESLLYEGLCWG